MCKVLTESGTLLIRIGFSLDPDLHPGIKLECQILIHIEINEDILVCRTRLALQFVSARKVLCWRLAGSNSLPGPVGLGSSSKGWRGP